MSIMSLKLLIMALMLTNMWSVFRIMEGYWIPKSIKRGWNRFWKRQWEKCKTKFRWLTREETVKREPLTDFVGRSIFKMPHGIAAEQERMREEIHASGKSVENGDVEFMTEPLPTNKRKFVQVPDERLDETFSDLRIEDVAKYSGEEEATPNADGNSFEDIDRAVAIARKPIRKKADIDHAGKVFSEMEGNELYEKLTSSSELAKRIRMILALCMEGTGNVRETMPTAEVGARPRVPRNFEDFNVLDFL